VSVDGFTKRPVSAAESLADRAMLHAVMRRPAEARQLAKEAATADPALPIPAEVEGMLNDLEGQKDAALAAYARAGELQSKNFYSYYRRAQLLWQPTLERAALEQIAGELERAITLNSNWAPGYSYLADVRVDLGDAGTALGLAKRAVSLDPGASYHRMTAARALAQLSRLDEALKEAERAVALAKTPEERQRAEQLVASLKGRQK
jgi:tetratricopeptide (TPR) repeat protein